MLSIYDLKGKRIWVTGHGGLVGGALVNRLGREDCEIISVSREDLDLRRQDAVESWIANNKPDAVIIAAATVGGIQANISRPAEFIYNNSAIATNIIDAAYQSGVEKLMFLGSSCMYPRLADQPIAESSLLTGELEPTNQWYAMAKIHGAMMCQAYRRQYGCDFIVAVPTNLYGPGDNFDPDVSHVVPAMIHKIDQALASGGPVEIWGTGTPRREFLLVDDAADGLVHLMKNYSGEEIINVAGGEDVAISDLAELIGDILGYRGEYVFDSSRPDGMPLKRLDAQRIQELGWRAKTSLREGLKKTYLWFKSIKTD